MTPLTIGELWALPTMLRIGALEYLTASVSVVTGMAASEKLKALPLLHAPPPLSDNEAIVANCFLSLRLISATDWKGFFEQTSHIEEILRQDPAGIYPSMDFETRNSYRNVVEELARNSAASEETVAKTAIEFASRTETISGASLEELDRKTHVGYYLIDDGFNALKTSLSYKPGPKTRLRQAVLAHPTLAYLGGIGGLTLLIVVGMLSYALVAGGSTIQLILASLLGCGLALEIAVNLIHWIITNNIPPRTLPRLDFSKGIPAGYRTMVVIPTLLMNETGLTSFWKTWNFTTYATPTRNWPLPS